MWEQSQVGGFVIKQRWDGSTVVTPSDPESQAPGCLPRFCQDVVRLAPMPLYNSDENVEAVARTERRPAQPMKGD